MKLLDKIMGDGHSPGIALKDLGDSLGKQRDYAHCRIVFENVEPPVVGYRDIKKADIPTESVPIFDDGETHYLNYDGTKLAPLVLFPNGHSGNDEEENVDNDPHSCFEAQFWDELEVILSLDTSWVEKIKLGVLIGLCVGVLIILFFIGAMAMG